MLTTRAVLIPFEDPGAGDRRMALPDVVRALGREAERWPALLQLTVLSQRNGAWYRVDGARIERAGWPCSHDVNLFSLGARALLEPSVASVFEDWMQTLDALEPEELAARRDAAAPEVAELPGAPPLVRGWIHARAVLAGTGAWTLETALRFVATCVVHASKIGIAMFHAQRRLVSFGASHSAIVVHRALEERGDTFARALADRVRELAGGLR